MNMAVEFLGGPPTIHIVRFELAHSLGGIEDVLKALRAHTPDLEVRRYGYGLFGRSPTIQTIMIKLAHAGRRCVAGTGNTLIRTGDVAEWYMSPLEAPLQCRQQSRFATSGGIEDLLKAIKRTGQTRCNGTVVEPFVSSPTLKTIGFKLPHWGIEDVLIVTREQPLEPDVQGMAVVLLGSVPFSQGDSNCSVGYIQDVRKQCEHLSDLEVQLNRCGDLWKHTYNCSMAHWVIMQMC